MEGAEPLLPGSCSTPDTAVPAWASLETAFDTVVPSSVLKGRLAKELLPTIATALARREELRRQDDENRSGFMA